VAKKIKGNNGGERTIYEKKTGKKAAEKKKTKKKY